MQNQSLKANQTDTDPAEVDQQSEGGDDEKFEKLRIRFGEADPSKYSTE